MSQLGLTNPVYPGEITQAGMLVALTDAFGTFYPVGSKPDTSVLAAGYRQAGALSELPTIECGRETEAVKTGIYGIAQELLFKGMSGKMSFKMFGFDAGLLALGLGVQPVVTATAPAVATLVATDAPTGNDVITVAGTYVVGEQVQVCASTDTAFSTNFARVASLGSGTIILDRKLRQAPGATPTVSKVTNVMIPIGGTSPKYFGFAGLVDFPNGRVALVNFPKVYSAKPLSFGLGSGSDAVAVPIELEALGTLDTTYGVLLGKIYIFN